MKPPVLLNREEFRVRDRGSCVFCGAPALAAEAIERGVDAKLCLTHQESRQFYGIARQ